MKGSVGILAAAVLHLFRCTADSAVVVVDMTGVNNASAYGFYGVTFQTGESNEYIRSVGFLLNYPGGYFDLDGSGSYSNFFAPVIGPLDGVAHDDIDWGGGNIVGGNMLHPAYLSFEFTPRSFNPGDSMRFAADTDFMPGDSGADFTGRVCIVIVELNIGVTVITNFTAVNVIRAEASASIANQVVLSRTRVADQLELSWPWFAEHSILEETTAPGSTPWITSPAIPSYTGSTWRAIVPLGPTTRFYRLREP